MSKLSIPWHERVRLAQEAAVSEPSIAKVARGEQVRGAAGRRALRAVQQWAEEQAATEQERIAS